MLGRIFARNLQLYGASLDDQLSCKSFLLPGSRTGYGTEIQVICMSEYLEGDWKKADGVLGCSEDQVGSKALQDLSGSLELGHSGTC